MGKFVINKDKGNQFKFNLKAVNGEIILNSQGYVSKSSCENGIESVRKHSQDDTMFERSTASNGSPYFNLKASNGQVIGTSERYSSTSAMETGIASVKTNAPKSPIEDNT